MAPPVRAGAPDEAEGRLTALTTATTPDPPGPLADWDLAARVGWAVAGSETPTVTREQVEALRRDLDRTIERADRLARTATGLGDGLPEGRVEVIGRRAWIRTNLDSIAWLTDPLAEKLTRGGTVSRAVSRRVLGAQLGAVFGFLSTKVLGQYEVFRPGDATPGRLLLVGPNLLQVERDVLPGSGLDAEQLRLGICLHESAHRLQFEGVDWMRGHLRGLLDRYLDDTRLDPDRVKQMAGRLGELVRDPASFSDPQRLLDIVLTPVQATTMREAQSLMTLLEGHGNVVMDWGAEAAADQHEGAQLDPSVVRTVLNKRRSGASDRALRRALGLAMKAEQYRVGEEWILEIARRHSREAFARVWRHPDAVPTAEELEDPDAWVARTSDAAA